MSPPCCTLQHIMEFLQPRKPPSDPGGGRPRTLTSESPNVDAAANDTASQSMRLATHLFEFFSKSRQSRKHNSTLRWTQRLQTRTHEVQYIARGGSFSVCRDLVALQRNPIRSIASRDLICRKSRKFDGFYQISQRRDTIEPNGEKHV